ncbi:cytochrome b6/f complex subunit IV (chloroplast) [Bryopsis sp. KO-2023]|uniref:Cytochrome b6-f complex subunit 6 n=1 Tax=Bryopsis plumosa TaxID=3130 RepID=A0A0D6E1X6_BRYPL|nr:cytochrome b6/f complex subunit IV [Bryopsis plumosa]YP_009130508.1 cytochrome b6/f complex subunit IV [Bryopsis plumosa]BEI31756.1 cytochrome b6/f complex subunit IV [Bryopsis sp. KO-2023]CEO91004.1 cytochrome b6/f complex subunit IV [Bryopsis plumosa]CEO91038.1 cytochrome b6/f complex subunit IV [Bryopsis plumosa]
MLSLLTYFSILFATIFFTIIVYFSLLKVKLI